MPEMRQRGAKKERVRELQGVFFLEDRLQSKIVGGQTDERIG